MKVVYSRLALAELDEIFADIRSKSPLGATRVEARLLHVIEQITKHPESAQRVAGWSDIRRAPLIRYPYVVYYRVTEGGITILRILHGKRRPLTPPLAAAGR